MTPLELAHRTLRAMLARAEGKGLLGSPAMSAPDLGTSGKAWVHHDPGVDPAPYLAAADEIAHGRISVFALREVDLGVPPRWNRDPKTGIEAPLVYGKLLDYRNPDLVGDIKYLWEPNRHHELVTLAQAYALSRKRRYYDALVEQLESWFIACPYALGPNWASALEAGIRLANWAAAWQLVQPIADAEFKARWLRSVYQHAYFVRHWFSAHSSANNHLIGEAAGLYVAALTWPHWPEMREWAATPRRSSSARRSRRTRPTASTGSTRSGTTRSSSRRWSPASSQGERTARAFHPRSSRASRRCSISSPR